MEISYTKGNTLVIMSFDATIREEHEATAAVTEFPVEKGANVSDHKRPELAKLSGEVFVTNSPITVPKSNLDGATGETRGQELVIPVKRSLPIAVPVVGALLAGAGALDSFDTINPLLLQFDGDFNRVNSIWKQFQDLVESDQLITITTSVRSYENMALKRVTLPITADDGDGGSFQFEASEIRFVETKVITVPKDKRGETKKAKGPKSPDGAASDNKSLLWKLLHP